MKLISIRLASWNILQDLHFLFFFMMMIRIRSYDILHCERFSEMDAHMVMSIDGQYIEMSVAFRTTKIHSHPSDKPSRQSWNLAAEI